MKQPQKILAGATLFLFIFLENIYASGAAQILPAIFPILLNNNSIGFQLPQSNYTAADLSMLLVYPRPDTETNASARHRNQYTGLEYRIPIAVRGGAWPFKYELTTAPTGATVGGTLDITAGLHTVGADYGVITWTPGTPGTYDFTAKVTDQAGSTVTVSWQVVVGTANWVFIDSGAGAGGVGTIGDPFDSLSDIDGAGSNKFVVFRGGAHTIPRNTTNNFTFSSDDPLTYIGYPGETAMLDFSASKFNHSFSDQYFGNLVYTNMATNYANSHFHLVSRASHRGVWFENTFQNMTSSGTSGTENPATLSFTSTNEQRNYNCIIRNTFQNLTAGENSGIVVLYAQDNMVIEHNLFDTTATSYGFRLKANTRYSSYRANTHLSSTDGRAIDFRNGADGNGTQGEQCEVVYNRVANSGSGNDAITLNWSGGTAGGPSWIRRNNLSGDCGSLDKSVSIIFDRNVHSDTGLPANWTVTNDVESTDFDASMDLTGTTRINYIGTHGAEVYE